jgi:V/A-type H+/Na+-transporting ATPase subunit C
METEGAAPLLAVERSLEQGLVDAYDHLLRALAGGLHSLVLALLRRLEVDNLKVILRGVFSGRQAEAGTLLAPLGRYERLPLEALLAAPTPADAIAALERGPYAAVLRDVASHSRDEGTLFPLEVALDLEYYRRLWSEIEALPRGDRAEATTILGARYDVTNIEWMLRYRSLYHLAPEEIFNYTLPYGARLDDDTVRAVAEAPDQPAAIAALPEPYRSLLAPWAQEANLWRLEVALSRYLWREARRNLGGYPFHVGAILGFLFLKEAEVHDVRAILEAKQEAKAAEDISAFLWGEA